MDNILHEALDPRAQLVFGTPRAQCMAHGLSTDFDLALFVGYHAGAGEPGVLSHTFSSLFTGYRVNGQTASEAEVNALYAASLGVPVGMVSGDNVICEAVRRRLPNTLAIPVKHYVGWTAANSLHPEAARVAIREGAAAAVRGAGSVSPVPLPQRLVLEVQMQVPTAAEVAALVPGAEQVDAFTVRREVDSPRDLIALTSVWYDLANSAMRARVAAINLLGRA
jgi:D-amino peptidase